jgi:hypothetical protein
MACENYEMWIKWTLVNVCDSFPQEDVGGQEQDLQTWKIAIYRAPAFLLVKSLASRAKNGTGPILLRSNFSQFL